jgi:hypothetical protein
MDLLKTIGRGILAGIITCALIGLGLAVALFSSILSVLFTIALIFTCVWFVLRWMADR